MSNVVRRPQEPLPSTSQRVDPQHLRPAAEVGQLGGRVVSIRTGARVLRARGLAASFRRGMTKLSLPFRSAEFKAERNLRHAEYRFDRLTNRLVEDLANKPDEMSKKDVYKRLVRIFAEGEKMLHNEQRLRGRRPDLHFERDYIARFETNLRESLDALETRNPEAAWAISDLFSNGGKFENLAEDFRQGVADGENDRLGLTSIKTEYDEFLPKAALKLLETLSGHQNRRIDDNTIMLGGVKYKHDRHVADGGYGSVDLYEAENGQKVVLKKPILQAGETPDDKLKEAMDELEAHRHAVRGDHSDHVIGLKGVIRTPGNEILLAVEYAPFGNTNSAINKIDKALEGGEISQKDANLVRLTLLKDMAEGVKRLKDKGMIHMDVKAPNFLIGGDGIARLSDFGDAKIKTVHTAKDNPVENPGWSAPELALPMKQMTDRRFARKADLAPFENDLIELRKNKEAGTISKEDYSRRRKEVVAEKKRVEEDIKKEFDDWTFTVDGRVDMWSVGVDAYRMFSGQSPFRTDAPVNTLEDLQGVADRGDAISLPEDSDVGLDEDDRAELDRLIKGMLHPDPEKRISPEEVLQSRLLQAPEIGGPAAREVIMGLTRS